MAMTSDKSQAPELVSEVISKFLTNLKEQKLPDGVVTRLKDLLTSTEKPAKKLLEAAMFGDDAIL